MHKYMFLRGSGQLMRRIIEDLEKIYYNYTNKKTGKHIGLLQLMPREMKAFELIFPETEKDNIKADIERIFKKHNKGQVGGVTLHWGPTKKDKYNKDGSERL